VDAILPEGLLITLPPYSLSKRNRNESPQTKQIPSKSKKLIFCSLTTAMLPNRWQFIGNQLYDVNKKET